MERTFHFYNCFVVYNGKITNINLTEMLDKIIVLEPSRRVRYVKQGNISLLKMQPPEKNIDYNDRKIVFGKFRTNKPYLGDIKTDRIEEIPDDVLELTSVFFRRNSRLLKIEYNHQGARPNAIENYLSEFLPIDLDNNSVWQVKLYPVEPNLELGDIERSDDIRKVEINIDLTANHSNIYNAVEHNSVLGELIDKSIETHEQMGANVASLVFGNGRKRIKGLQADVLGKFIRGLNIDGDIFQSLRVEYISKTTQKLERVDLKNPGVLKENHRVDGNGWEFITDFMEKNFYDNGRTAEAEHNRFSLYPFKIPKLKL